MGRLTKEMRRDIINRCLKDVFDKREAALQEYKYKMSLEVIRVMLTEDQWKTIASLPKEWFYTATSKSVYYSDGSRNRCLTLDFKNAIQLPVFIVKNSWHVREMTEDQQNKINAYLRRREELDDQREKLEREVTHLLSGITTEKRLSEVWPEGTKYMTPNCTTENLPATTATNVVVLIEALKKMEDTDA